MDRGSATEPGRKGWGELGARSWLGSRQSSTLSLAPDLVMLKLKGQRDRRGWESGDQGTDHQGLYLRRGWAGIVFGMGEASQNWVKLSI